MTSRYINWRIKSTQGKGQKLERVERLIFSSKKIWCCPLCGVLVVLDG